MGYTPARQNKSFPTERKEVPLIRMGDFMDLVNLKKQGYSISAIARKLNLDRKTVSKYLNADCNPTSLLPKTRNCCSKLDAFKELIAQMLDQAEMQQEERLSAVFIHQKLSDKGFNGSVSLVRKYLQKHREPVNAKLVPHIETMPGKEAQVDWGEKYLYTESGKRKKVYIFTMSLSHSDTKFVAFFPRANRYYFILGHILAFEFFGGVPETLLYDQTRCAVDKPGFSKVTWNKTFYAFAAYYGFIPKACKPYSPQRKGRVESLVKYTKKNFLPLRVFEGFEELNCQAIEWLNKVNGEVHSRTGRIPFELLKEEELPCMRALPEHRFELYQLETRKVFLDSTISFRNKRYSVPPKYLQQIVTVKFKPEHEEFKIFCKEEHICTHKISTKPDKFIILKEHQEEISSIIRQRFKVLKQKRKSPPEIDPDERIKRSLNVYEEVGQ
jgi:transposase